MAPLSVSYPKQPFVYWTPAPANKDSITLVTSIRGSVDVIATKRRRRNGMTKKRTSATKTAVRQPPSTHIAPWSPVFWNSSDPMLPDARLPVRQTRCQETTCLVSGLLVVAIEKCSLAARRPLTTLSRVSRH